MAILEEILMKGFIIIAEQKDNNSIIYLPVIAEDPQVAFNRAKDQHPNLNMRGLMEIKVMKELEKAILELAQQHNLELED